MQEDLATILIKVWINFSTKFIVTSPLFDTVRAIFEIQEFILRYYTLIFRWDLQMIKTNVNAILTDTDNLENSDSI